MTKLTITDMQDNVNDGVYDDVVQKIRILFSEVHVFDEDKSVKWNREKINEENKKVKAHNERVRENKNKGRDKFLGDLNSAIANETGLSVKQASVISAKAWSEGHSSGYWTVLDVADDMIDMVNEIKNMEA